MNLDDMIAVLEAAKRGEKIEYKSGGDWRLPEDGKLGWNFYANDYRIAPKKEMPLVENAREWSEKSPRNPELDALLIKLADRIEELEIKTQAVTVKIPVEVWTADELLAEIKRRTGC